MSYLRLAALQFSLCPCTQYPSVWQSILSPQLIAWGNKYKYTDIFNFAYWSCYTNLVPSSYSLPKFRRNIKFLFIPSGYIFSEVLKATFTILTKMVRAESYGNAIKVVCVSTLLQSIDIYHCTAFGCCMSIFYLA